MDTIKKRFVVLITFLLLNNYIVSTNLTQSVKLNLPIDAIMIFSNILNKSSKCKIELDLLQRGVKEKKLWSLKIFDASGEPKPGFIYGNNFWLGSQKQCLDVINRQQLEITPDWQRNNSKYRNIDDEFPPFEVNYFVSRFHHNSTIQYHFRMPNEDVIYLGLCLPSSCTVNELEVILKKIFQERSLTMNDLYSMDFNLINVRNIKDNYRWALDWNIIIALGFLIIIFLMATVSTFYDIFIYQKQLNIQELSVQSHKTSSEMIINISEIYMENKPVKFKDIILCFSIYTNTIKLFNIETHSNTIAIINGIKFIGMVTLIFLHVGYFGIGFMDNQMWLWRLFGYYIVGVMKTSALFVVDTFFFFGGFLMAWPHFKNQQKNEAQYDVKINSMWTTFLNRMIKRFMRLTPVYTVTLCIIQLSITWFSANSLFVISQENPQENCKKYWWRNLLYINNFFGLKSMCMAWTWYLSNDVQFYIISQIFLILSDRYFYTCSTILFFILALSIIIPAYVSYTQNLIFTTDDIWLKADIFYFPPWMRFGPYLIGIITAYILVQIKGKLNISKTKLFLLWIIGCSCSLTVLLTNASGIRSVIMTAIYVALSKVVWSIGIAWLLIACQTDNAGFICKILELKILNPLSDMSYCVYLLNPILINMINLISESSIHFDFAHFIITSLGFTVITYTCAYILTITVEMPYIRIYKLITKPRLVMKQR